MVTAAWFAAVMVGAPDSVAAIAGAGGGTSPTATAAIAAAAISASKLFNMISPYLLCRPSPQIGSTKTRRERVLRHMLMTDRQHHDFGADARALV